MPQSKWYVYVLKSQADRTRSHIGMTTDWCAVLDAHNSGKCSQTADARPWAIDLVVPFSDRTRATAFERYLKSGRRKEVAKATSHRRSNERVTRAAPEAP